MMNYRNVTLAVVGLCLSLSFLAAPAMAVEKDGLKIMNGKVIKFYGTTQIGPIDSQTTLSNGARVMVNGKMVTKDGKEVQLQEGQMVMMDGKIMESDKGTGK